MNTPSREEVDAKLEAYDTRLGARVAAIDLKIDNFVSQQTAQLAAYQALMDVRMTQIERWLSETNAGIKNLRSTVIVTAITAALATVFGIAAFNATVLSNMVASFESGKNTTAAQADIKRQIYEIDALLKTLQANGNPSAKPAPPNK